ncbi:cobalamin-independent synthase [Syncephalis plumigaleata]|nr:cobalamin-independent synthase [Syncephalis plumigaleata]
MCQTAYHLRNIHDTLTVDIIRYAQSLTSRPLKGPITCLQWSFVHDDQSRRDTAFQLALAIRDEVQDLEAAGIPAIQMTSQPFVKLVLHRVDCDEYLKWAVDVFLLSTIPCRILLVV